MPDETKNASSTEANQAQPGQVVAPGNSLPTATPPPVVTPAEPSSAPAPTPVLATPDPSPPPEVTPTPETPAQETGFFNAKSPEESAGPTQDVSLSWAASEYIEHDKNTGWYFLLGLVAIIVAALIYLITRDKTSVIVIIVGAIAFGVYAGRPPRQVTYQLDNEGLSIGQKQFGYSEFRSFAIVPEGAFTSVIFVHHKRFAALTTIYLAPDHENEIVAALAARLPMEEHHIDLVEHLMRRIRF